MNGYVEKLIESVLSQDTLINEAITSLKTRLDEQVRKPFKMDLPQDLQQLAQIITGNGRELYVVGGAVRDAVLGKEPKDFDVATDAKPDEIITILSEYPEYKLLEVGKAFGVVNVITPEGNEYEIATFREDVGKGRRPDDVEFSTIEQDVKRRDLTINALFYDIAKQEIVDYVGGLEDIEKGVVRAVGEPTERFDEDRLRILRAIRFAARMGSGLDEKTEEAIRNDNSLEGVSAERIRDEFLKSVKSARSVPALLRMYDQLNLWDQILPGLEINEAYPDTKNIPVLLALLLRNNDFNKIKKRLNKLTYSSLETKQTAFLNLFQQLEPDNAYQMKKAYKGTQLSDDDLIEYSKAAGVPDQKLVQAFTEFELSVSGQEIMDDGFQGKAIGQEIERRETENFKQLL